MLSCCVPWLLGLIICGSIWLHSHLLQARIWPGLHGVQRLVGSAAAALFRHCDLCTRHEHVMWLGRSSRWPLVSTPQDAVPQDPNQVRLPKFVAHK